MTKRGLWQAILNPSSPRHDDWRRILGTDEVPLESAKTHHVTLGEEHAEAYKLDVPNLTADQRERLVAWLMNKFVGNLCPSRREILSSTGAREVYYQERGRSIAERREQEVLEQAAEEERQRRALSDSRRKEKERLLRMAPAEAWMSQHETSIDADNAPTRGALRNLLMMERLRFKAARERVREIGIR